MPVHSPPTQAFLSENQFYHHQQQQPQPVYRPSINSVNINPIRKRPKFPYQFASPYSHYSSDLTSPIYQNYANYYQYTSQPYQQNQQASSLYYDYYNPTHYPSSQTHSAGASNGANYYGHPLHQPNYYTNNYANQYGYQRLSPQTSNGNLPNFINNIRDANGPLGQLSTVGTQFSKALEDISINDDLQCVPKLLCQMIRNPRRPSQLPSFLNVPGITAIISALPSSSPLMNFGRAALLGLSGGECDTAYPRCPRDETQVLYYLNNHRGGFFRFFNGGSSFGGDEDFLQQQASQQQQQVNQQQPSQGLNMLALQALADTLSGNSGGGNLFNLNNLFSSPSNQRPTVQQQQYYQGLQADQSQSAGGFLSSLKPSTLTDVVSNLLTGIGNRFTRHSVRNKRSMYDEGHKIQRRIVNLKDNVVKFIDAAPEQHKNTLFDELERPFTFSNDNRINSEKYQQQNYALKFPHDVQSNSAINQGNFVSSSDVANRLKMLFPDVENFSEQFTRNLLRLMLSDQGKEILTGSQRPINNLNIHSVNRYPATQSSENAGNSGFLNYNQYSFNNRQQQQKQQNKYTNNGNRSHIVYVTNGQGQLDYTLNELTGEKTRY
ncbi:hypothetical protein ACKWTF_007695 [Chironomus riparius]